ncbi:hypothetical protein BOTBODRAFT_559971 [Botryobasidium botryosum FD-172 SS1]|uniref:C2H2-type domain-containing protein n=1 Tax=Botryobasidium botryosum (strain FD-172 SS1) TaxID=930990 RepID=A0A067MA16_BOTB1|nr:hypothetical protein BOTBODRAFT_559971 [Botryobasidium botryosum FD-172 SS1]
MLLSSQIHHFCSALPQTLPLSFAPVHNSTSVSGQTLGHQQHGVLEANRLTRVLLENVAREMQCVWPECTFRAASWALLNKHVVQTHCVTPAAVLRNVSSASSIGT